MNDIAPTLDTPAVHPTYLKLLCMMLRSHGVDVDAVLAAAGLGTWKELSGRDAMVPQRAVNRLVAECLRATGRASLGLEVGGTIQISSHGPLGYAVVASKDLRQALETVARYVPLRHGLLRLRLRETTEGAAFELMERLDMGESRKFVSAVLFATFLRLMEAVVGQRMDSLAVDLPFAEPPWRGEIDRIFKGRVRFGAQRLVFHIAQDALQHPCMTADQQAHDKACLECERLLTQVATTTSMAQRVRELLAGREGQYPKLSDAAAFFSVSASTLIRRLKVESTSFQALLDDTRRERAHWYLTQTQLTVEDIAARLGYVDTTNFSRTFRRWYGTTPSEVRRA
jgi:AraC-like DNA-binding protein